MQPLFPDLAQQLQDLERAIAFYRAVFLIAAIVTWLACAGFTAYVAEAKGWGRLNWFLLGLCFGFVALVAAAGLPKRDKVEAEKSPYVGLGKRRPEEEDTSDLGDRLRRFEERH